MKWDFYHAALLTALVEGTGALLTLYWVKFNPFECHFFTCQNPPFWLGMAMFVSLAAGVIIPASGLVPAVTRLLHSSRSKMESSDSQIPISPGASLIERIPGRFRLFEVTAFCFLVATGVGLYIVHWLYTQFYFACYLPGPIPPLGVNCSNIFANALFADWTVATIVFSLAAGVVGSLVSGRKSSEKYEPPKERQSSRGSVQSFVESD